MNTSMPTAENAFVDVENISTLFVHPPHAATLAPAINEKSGVIISVMTRNRLEDALFMINAPC
jgi:hypothetical protein